MGGCQKCVKIYVMLVSGLIICLGITLMFITQFAMHLEDYVPSDKFTDWVKYFKMALMILAGLIIEIGIMGITFFSLIFLAIGVVAIAIVQSTVNKIDCSNLDVLDDASSVIKKSTDLLCTTSCPCNCQNQEVLQILASRSNTNTDIASQLSNLLNGGNPVTTNLVVSSSGVVRAQDCPTFEAVVGSYDEITKALGKVEEKFDCSGLCSVGSIYLFSDINRGIPKNMCIQEILDEMKKLLTLLGIIGLSVGGLLFITIFVACFLCCKAKRNTPKVTDYNNVDAKSETPYQTPHQQQPQNYQMQQYY